MLAFLKRFFPSKTGAAPVSIPPSRVSVQFDDQKIYTFVDQKPEGQIDWDDITLISIRIEDEWLPFPYWYVGNVNNLLRIPNDAQGAKELFFEGFKDKIPGYATEATYRTIVEASGALQGTFVLWKSAAG